MEVCQERKVREKRSDAHSFSRIETIDDSVSAATPKQRSDASSPHPALDRRVERGGRDLLLASFVDPGARRGPGHAAGVHAKSKREREIVFSERRSESSSLSKKKRASTTTASCQFDPLFFPRFQLYTMISSTPLARASACRGSDFAASTSFSRPAAAARRGAQQRCKQPLAAVAAAATAVASRCGFAALLTPLYCPFQCAEASSVSKRHGIEGRRIEKGIGEALHCAPLNYVVRRHVSRQTHFRPPLFFSQTTGPPSPFSAAAAGSPSSPQLPCLLLAVAVRQGTAEAAEAAEAATAVPLSPPPPLLPLQKTSMTSPASPTTTTPSPTPSA